MDVGVVHQIDGFVGFNQSTFWKVVHQIDGFGGFVKYTVLLPFFDFDGFFVSTVYPASKCRSRSPQKPPPFPLPLPLPFPHPHPLPLAHTLPLPLPVYFNSPWFHPTFLHLDRKLQLLQPYGLVYVLQIVLINIII